MRAPFPVLLVAAFGALASCRAAEDGWTYSVTRSMWGALEEGSLGGRGVPPGRSGGWEGEYAATSVEVNNGAGGIVVLLGILLVVPLAIDTALLPVTATHDLFTP